MGKVILCAGKRSEMPYLVRGTGIKIATIEELCYVLKHNLDMIDNSSIERDMAVFIRDELGIPECGNGLEELILSGADFKDKIVLILKSCDLYNDEEINAICDEIDEIATMSGSQRRKRRADRYMNEGNFIEAAKEYRGILALGGQDELDIVMIGDIKHNLAVVEMHNGETETAISLFNEAFESNQREQSLKSYLLALKLSKNTARYRAEVQRLVTNVQLFNDVENEVNAAEEDFEQSSEYTEISRLKVLWQQGLRMEAKRLSDEMISSMKQRYRQQSK